MNKFPLYNYKSINKLSQFLKFKDKKEFNKFLNKLKLDSMSFYKIYKIKNKKNRKVYECNSFIKRIHSRIRNCFKQIEAPEYLFSGVKKKSYINNANYHKNSKSFYIIDISKFYPSITKEKIYKNLISSFNQSHNVADAISDIITIEHEEKRFLVTGSPLSQIVAYFINKPMFDKINKISKQYNILFTVYVDDLTFSSKENIPSKFKYEIQNIIEYYNYSYSTEKIQSKLLHKKTEYYPAITGVAIHNGSKLDLPEERKERLLDFIQDFKKLTNLEVDDFFKNLDKLNGLITEAIQINKDKYFEEKINMDKFVKDFLISNAKKTKEYILNNFSILSETVNLDNINEFSKKYLNAITKTTRLLNIISIEPFREEIHHLINTKYKIFIYNNKSNLDLLSSNPIPNPLINKILSDYKKNKIY